MKLNVKGLALSLGVLWGAMMFGVASGHEAWGYGADFLRVMDSLYPGYHAGAGFGSVIWGTLYGMLDGAVAGAVIAWLYNRFSH